MEPLCSELAEPTVRASVLPHFRQTVEMIDTSGEKFHFGYECEGSATVARNLTRYVSQLYHCSNCERTKSEETFEPLYVMLVHAHCHNTDTSVNQIYTNTNYHTHTQLKWLVRLASLAK